MNMIRQYHRGIYIPFFAVPIAQGLQGNSAFLWRKEHAFPASPGNEINAPRLLPMGQVSAGYLKRLHRLKTCATCSFEFIFPHNRLRLARDVSQDQIRSGQTHSWVHPYDPKGLMCYNCQRLYSEFGKSIYTGIKKARCGGRSMGSAWLNQSLGLLPAD